jgi:hypothetical protein
MDSENLFQPHYTLLEQYLDYARHERSSHRCPKNDARRYYNRRPGRLWSFQTRIYRLLLKPMAMLYLITELLLNSLKFLTQ